MSDIAGTTTDAEPEEVEEPSQSAAVQFSSAFILRGASGQALVDAVGRAMDEHAVATGKQHKARRKDAAPTWRRVVEAQTAGLVKVHLGGFSAGLSTPLRKGGGKSPFDPLPASPDLFVWPSFTTRYGVAALPAHVMIKVAHSMEACGLTTRIVGWSGGPRTLLRPTPRFAELVAEHGVDLRAVDKEEGGELIELRGAKARPGERGELIEYPDTDQTQAMRREMEKLNAWLEAADLSIDQNLPDVDTTHRRMVRVFNRPKHPTTDYRDFTLGGRLYGGFWQGLNADLRLRHLRIDGYPIAVADYSSAWPRMAYAASGTEPPEGDLYASIVGHYSRKGLKVAVNAALASSKVPTRFPRHSRELFGSKDRWEDVLNAIRKAHPPLDKVIGTEFALKAMRLDSEVLLAVLRELMGRGIVALPIHDAVAVSALHADTAKQIMEEAFRRIVGVGGPVVVTIYQHA